MAIHDTSDLSPAAAYGLLTSLVVPRPIAWVGTRSAAGVDNLAPHSYFTVVSSDPPIVVFVSVGTKDTLDNLTATGVFTISVVTRPHLDAMNATAARLPPDVDEFTRAGLGRRDAATVAAPVVADAPASLECGLREVRAMGNGNLVFGDVRRITVDDCLLDDDQTVDMRRLDPVGRLSASQYLVGGEVVARDRPTAEY